MKKIFQAAFEENGGEYYRTITIAITCNKVIRINNTTIKADGVTIELDELICEVKEISSEIEQSSNDKEGGE